MSKTILFIPIIALLLLPVTGVAFAADESEEEDYAIVTYMVVLGLIVLIAWALRKWKKPSDKDKDEDKDEDQKA